MEELAKLAQFEDGACDFFGLILPALISHSAWKQNTRKRRRGEPKIVKKDGRIGRTWSQRKRGDMKPEDFSWWRLIHKPDIADLQSRNGKVSVFKSVCVLLFVCVCFCVRVRVCICVCVLVRVGVLLCVY